MATVQYVNVYAQEQTDFINERKRMIKQNAKNITNSTFECALREVALGMDMLGYTSMMMDLYKRNAVALKCLYSEQTTESMDSMEELLMEQTQDVDCVWAIIDALVIACEK